jgi:membrane protein implicated in regulation of membrane protease activity
LATGIPRGPVHVGHGHLGHIHPANAHAGHVHGASHGNAGRGSPSSEQALGSWFGSLINPSCFAVFLAWFGGVGYILDRHSGFALWLDLLIASALGFGGAWLLAAFLRFLQSKEKPLDPADYEMVGVLGRVSCVIRPDGVGEMIYVRDGARRPVPAKSEGGGKIERDEEVIVVRYEKGIAYVHTWDAMTQPGRLDAASKSLLKETKNVQ